MCKFKMGMAPPAAKDMIPGEDGNEEMYTLQSNRRTKPQCKHGEKWYPPHVANTPFKWNNVSANDAHSTWSPQR